MFKKFIGNKKFYKRTLVVAVPMMLQQLVASSVNLLDNLMVGQLGDAALGGVAAVNKFYMIAIFAGMGLIAASSIFLAQFYGAKKVEKMQESFRFSIVYVSLIMIFFFVASLLFAEQIVHYFTPDKEIISKGIAYFAVAKYTFLPMALSLSIAGAMRSVGETKIPMYCSFLAVFINAVLNYGFIFGNFGLPRLEVAGAALATLIARIIETGILLIVIWKMDLPFKTKVKDLFKIPSELSRKIFIKAAPLATNEVLWSFGMATLFKLYGTRGSEVISGYAVANTISDLFFVLFGGMAAASTVLISHHLGANELEEAKSNAYRLIGFSMMLAVVFGILMFGSSFIVPNWFQISKEAREITTTTLRIMSCMFWIYMLNTSLYFTLRAGGDTKSTFYMDSIYMWTFNIPLVAAVAYFTDFDIYTLYIIGQSTDLVKMFIAYRLVRKEKWVVNLAIEPEVL